MSRSSIAYALVALGVPAITATTLDTAPLRERTHISGVFSMKVGQQQALPIASQADPVLLLTESSGTNRSTGKVAYMDGAQVTNREIADLTQGNGPHQGYLTEIQGPDTSVARWQGKVVTTLGPDQKPVTRFEGSWSKLKGTGRYEGITGAGSYQGRMTSSTEYTIEWRGEISTPRTASR
ncbi:MAG TPA: hypothetical protein VFR72_05925 [Gemmatimonadales bacterium]|nr:hypothetical protein [Gemmatimonadales bacterium]